MYTEEIFKEFEQLDFKIPISKYMNIVNNSPQITNVTHNFMIWKYQMTFNNTDEPLFFQITNE